jgi:two-component system cell cycle sensor histidine kinase/response regulator CckA
MALTPDEVFPDKTAKWFADFINTLPLAVFRESVDGRIVYCNNALAELLGFKLFSELIDYPIIQFYRDRKDRSSFVEALINQGRVLDAPLSFRKRDGKSIWCTVTARAVLDESGKLAYLDGVMRDVTEKIQEKAARRDHEGRTKGLDDFAAFLNPAGKILEINKAGAELLGFRVEDLVGKPIVDHVVPRFRDLFSTFLSIVAKTGREEGILTIMDKEGEEKNLEFYAFVDDRAGMSDHLHLVARNVTERIKYQKEQLSKEKFVGILEMAGGVAHKLNQPLTVIRNTIMEVMSTLSPEDSLYEKMVRIHLQIERINEITKKIVNIKKYESMDYVAGMRIVDIDKTS